MANKKQTEAHSSSEIECLYSLQQVLEITVLLHYYISYYYILSL